MRSILIAGIALALAAPGTAQNPGVTDTSFTAPDGTRTLQHTAVIAAAVAILWKAFTDTAEFQRWSAPNSAIDLRTGGSLEASYDAKVKLGERDTIRHRIVTYLPEKMVVFQNQQAPRDLKDGELLAQTVTVIQYEPLGPNSTRVTISSTGWKDTPAWNGLYKFFQSGNAQTLAAMKKVYEAPAK
jgi:uncharacterized protein YndB with AHSA1/START domain